VALVHAVQGLIEAHPQPWQAAVSQPFLDGIREGWLPAADFQAWLIQDHHFLADLLAFQARLLAEAPRPDQAVLAGGLVGLEAELGWFESRLEGEPTRPRSRITDAYGRHLRELNRGPYAAAIVSLWALERVYLDAWTGAAPGAPGFREFVAHWTAPAFAAYVTPLATAADAALEAAGESERAAAESAFLATLELERDFWAARG
jgi:thiaminase/transcriptional activator TenA